MLMLLFEVMDKEWPLSWILVFFLGCGLLTFFICRRWPALVFLVTPIVGLVALGRVAELTDPFVGPAIRHEAGLHYVVLSYLSMATGLALPCIGVCLGRKRRKRAAGGAEIGL